MSDNQLQVVYSDGCCTKNGGTGAKAGIGIFWGPGDDISMILVAFWEIHKNYSLFQQFIEGLAMPGKLS